MLGFGGCQIHGHGFLCSCMSQQQQQQSMNHYYDAIRQYGAGGSSGSLTIASPGTVSVSSGSSTSHEKPDRKKVLLLIGR